MSIRSNLLGSLPIVLHLVWAGTAVAGSDSNGFLTNWPGKIKAEYNSSALPVSPPPVATLIAAAASQSFMCSGIQNALPNFVPVVKFNSCTIPEPPELRGKMIAPNELGIKIIIKGANISFDTKGPDDPTIHISADIEVDSAIQFAGSINGDIKKTTAAYTTSPMAVVMPAVKLSNVNVSTKNVLASLASDVSSALGGPSLQSLGDMIAQQGGQFGGFLTTQLSNAVSQPNGLFHDAAAGLAAEIRTVGFPPNKADPNANAFFLLGVSIDAQQNLVVNFQRNGNSPPVADNCFAQSLDYATVTVECYSQTVQGLSFDVVDTMHLMRFNAAASTAATKVRELADDGVSNSWDTPVPRLTVPFFLDTVFQTYPQPPATATYQVCSVNDWGQGCGPEMTVTIDQKVNPHLDVGPPACGPNSHPYQPCKAFKTNVSEGGGGFVPAQPMK